VIIIIADFGNLLEDNLETAQFDGKTWSNPKHGGGSVAGHYIHWLCVPKNQIRA
jgi:hypothetical protein